ncbi:hypothetical protein ABAZ39_14705 (plasmid) [Azospirillum argentinense]|uniref:Uncharacterized protein n=1 Tax=Azospirillum argentinense TaxID=2970906 RepID=A0A060DG89_9PROT|nr:hypothetical protein ABAZ39_14705 [Azospirillum argentinense]EZQ06395.1 hypothetical protein ABAZ39_14880 [Azospirillum argentinense]
MTNLVHQIEDEKCDLVEQLHAAICEACDEIAGSDQDRRKSLRNRLIVVIGKALLTECASPPVYNLDYLPDWAKGTPRPPRSRI